MSILLYGINVVKEALKAPENRMERICVQRGRRDPWIQEIMDLGRQKHVPVSFEEKSWLDRKTDGKRHQGVIAYVAEILTLTVEEVVARAAVPGLLVVLDGIEDPHNTGAIIRSSEVAGADGVLIPRRRSSGLTAAVVKTSAGAASHIRIARVPNTARSLDYLKEHGYWIVGLDVDAPQPVWEADFTLPTVLVLGNEASGLRRLVKGLCDFHVSIPMAGRVQSHNVGVAAGIALYEVLRQRRTSCPTHRRGEK